MWRAVEKFLGLVVLTTWVTSGAAAQELVVLADRPLSPLQAGLLRDLSARSAPGWMSAARRLQGETTVSVVRELKELAAARDDEIRCRAGFVLSRIPAGGSLAAVVELVVECESVVVRRTVSSHLLSARMSAQLAAARLIDRLRRGLQDADRDVQLAVAMVLAQAKDAGGASVLKKNLRHRDHHRRESAAEALAEIGDSAGASVLIRMLKRSDRAHPLLRANRSMRRDKPAWDRLLAVVRKERVRVCGHLGMLKCKAALPTLKRLTRSADPSVAAAAKKAVARIGSENADHRNKKAGP